MWVCAPCGMYMPALRPPHTVPCDDDRLLQIRSRRIIDLRRLKAEYLPELGDIIELKYTDYEYRAYCTHEQWAAALAKMAMDIDYVKFKEQSEKKYNDTELHNTYVRMWGTVFSALSSKKHQSTYWSSARTKGKGKGKKHLSVVESHWPDVTQPIDWGTPKTTHSDLISDEELDALTRGWDNDLPTVIRMPNGNIDHSYCSHANSRNARRRCQRAND